MERERERHTHTHTHREGDGWRTWGQKWESLTTGRGSTLCICALLHTRRVGTLQVSIDAGCEEEAGGRRRSLVQIPAIIIIIAIPSPVLVLLLHRRVSPSECMHSFAGGGSCWKFKQVRELGFLLPAAGRGIVNVQKCFLIFFFFYEWVVTIVQNLCLRC